MAGTPRPRTFGGFARRSLGISLLLAVVVLWTASNFLASTIFADSTFAKPFFVTYVNTSVFIFPLFTIILSRLRRLWLAGKLSQINSVRSLLGQLDFSDLKAEERGILRRGTADAARSDERGLVDAVGSYQGDPNADTPYTLPAKLGLKATAKLSFQFCILWFLANYFAMACLQYTTVGSTTILTSTSGVWTLILGAAVGIERFTTRKLLGVITSLAGIILISRLDVSKTDSPEGGTFPEKSPGEIALGDTMAAFSAILYGVYTIVMKKQIGDESRVDMQLFFGLVGLFNTFLLWPGFIIMHFSGIELFHMPQTTRVWIIILVNSLTSLLSDICWAYAMLLTTPLVVTVGLSLTIPLSLVGQIFLQGQYASPLYWAGGTVVFLSFLLVNHESRESLETEVDDCDVVAVSGPGEI